MAQRKTSSTKANTLQEALLGVKSKMEAILKEAQNPYFKSNYADLNAHLRGVEPLLQEAGLILLQPCVCDEHGNVVSSRIIHATSGEMIESSLRLPKLDDMQKLGGAITYARRYTLSALLGMQAEDDDGNIASGKPSKTSPATSGGFASNVSGGGFGV